MYMTCGARCLQVPLEAAPAKQQNGYYKELGPCTPDAGLDEDHAWRIRVRESSRTRSGEYLGRLYELSMLQ